jgi:hypothetical protein
LKEHVVEAHRVSQDQGAQFMGEGEDHMEIVGWQEFFGTIDDPACFLKALTLGTVSISAGVEGEAGKPAPVLTNLYVTAELWCATSHDVPDGLLLFWIDGMGVCVRLCVHLEDVSQF